MPRLKPGVVTGGAVFTGTTTLDQDSNAVTLSIDAESTTANVIDVVAPATTTGNVLEINSSAKTTGSLIHLVSNSSSTGSGPLMNIINENAAAIGTTCLNMRQDAQQSVISMNLGVVDSGFLNFNATVDADATSAISSLTTSGATTHHIQIQINGVTAWFAASTTDPS